MIHTSSSISTSEVTSLKHEVLDDAVELAALVSLADSLLCEFDEVLDSFRNGASEKTNFNATSRASADLNVEPNLRNRSIYYSLKFSKFQFADLALSGFVCHLKVN